MIKTEFKVYFRLKAEVAESMGIPEKESMIIVPKGMQIEEYAPIYISVQYDISDEDFEIIDIIYWDEYV